MSEFCVGAVRLTVPTRQSGMDRQRAVAVSGWDSFQAIEPYLNAPTAKVVNDAFEEAGLHD